MSGKSATNLFAGLEQILTENEPLARHTWLGIGGRKPPTHVPGWSQNGQAAGAVIDSI